MLNQNIVAFCRIGGVAFWSMPSGVFSQAVAICASPAAMRGSISAGGTTVYLTPTPSSRANASIKSCSKPPGFPESSIMYVSGPFVVSTSRSCCAGVGKGRARMITGLSHAAKKRISSPERMLFKLIISSLCYSIGRFGEVAEWSNVPDSKSGVLQGTVGSNPTLSAKRPMNKRLSRRFFILPPNVPPEICSDWLTQSETRTLPR